MLLVEDQPEIREPIGRRLEAEGYRVVAAEDGESAIERFREDTPDVIVLDLMLPVLDGLSVCRRVRAESDVPILVLSARSEDSDIVVGLELGADDYLTKPFRLNVLLARIRALLRRTGKARGFDAQGGLLRAGRISLDRAACEARVDGKPVSLTPLEFRLLAELASHPGRVLSHETLLRSVWDYEGYDLGLVTTHIKRLRSKVEVDPANPQVILTVRGFGYKIADSERDARRAQDPSSRRAA